MFIKQIKSHTAHLESLVRTNYVTETDLVYHEKQISFLQYERIAHLHVLMGVILAQLISVIVLILSPSAGTIALAILFMMLLIPYVFHYFVLENTIQYWYQLYNSMLSIMKSHGYPSSFWYAHD